MKNKLQKIIERRYPHLISVDQKNMYSLEVYNIFHQLIDFVVLSLSEDGGGFSTEAGLLLQMKVIEYLREHENELLFKSL